MDLRQEYSAVSTCRAFSFSTCSWKTRMWSMKATTRSADMGEACRPAAANRGATWSGMEHWAAFRTKSSLHDMRSSATWNTSGTELLLQESNVKLLSSNHFSGGYLLKYIVWFKCMLSTKFRFEPSMTRPRKEPDHCCFVCLSAWLCNYYLSKFNYI